MTQQKVSMKTLHERLSQLGPTETVLDVRGRDEFAEGHVPGAINIPHDEVLKRAQELKSYTRIYIHCRSGKRAQMAWGDLEKAKLSAELICISDGGMMDWAAAGYEISKKA